MTKLGYLFAFGMMVVAGCGSSGNNGTGAGGSGGGGGCPTLTNDAPGVTEAAGTGTIPAMTGGTVADGTYMLTERLDFSGGTCGCTTHTKLIFSSGGTVLQGIFRTDPDPDMIYAATVSTSGTTMTWNFSCPGVMTLTRQYTATPTTLRTVDEQMQLETYTLQ